MTTFFLRLKGFRTLLVNGVIVIGGLLQAVGVIDVAPDPALAGEAFDLITGGGSMIIGAINIGLRLITSTAALSKD